MSSIEISGNRYRVKPESADRFGPFGHTFLAEGDSWMDASSIRQGSLPEFLARAYNRQGVSNLFINISTSGHTLTRITDMMNDDFGWWLNQQKYDGILFSAGGNDLIDAARDPDPGMGLLRDMRGQPVPAVASECVHQEALTKLVDKYLNPNFGTIYKAVRKSKQNASTPIFLNSYDTPVARDAPAIRGLTGPWLFEAYRKNGIDRSLWNELTKHLFGKLAEAINGWASGRSSVTGIPTTGVLVPADPDSSGESGDWVNEIHPSEGGWKKQAQVWLPRLPA